MITEKNIIEAVINKPSMYIPEKHIDNKIYRNNDFIGNDLTAFYYGKKANLKIFKGTSLIKSGKKLDTSI